MANTVKLYSYPKQKDWSEHTEKENKRLLMNDIKMAQDCCAD